MKTERKTLDSVAPRQSVRLLVNGEVRNVITQDWKYKNLVVIPESDFHLTSWMIVHQPSGIPVISSKYSCIAFSPDKNYKICATIESVRAIALLLSKVGVPDKITEKTGVMLRQLFEEAGIN